MNFDFTALSGTFHIKLMDSWLREKILFRLSGSVSSSHSEWEWEWKVIDFEVLWHACVLSVYNLIKSQLKGGGGVLAVHIKASNVNCIVCMGIVRTVWLSQLSGWALEAQALDFCQLFSFIFTSLTSNKCLSHLQVTASSLAPAPEIPLGLLQKLSQHVSLCLNIASYHSNRNFTTFNLPLNILGRTKLTSVAVPCRDRRIFRRVFRLHCCVRSAVSLNFH